MILEQISPLWKSAVHAKRSLLLLAPFLLTLAACAAPFSELQSARLAGRGRLELTAAYSHVDAAADGETAKLQDVYALHAATGLTDKIDLRVRFDHIRAADDGGAAVTASVIGVGPKIALVRDRLAIYAPIGFAFAGEIENSETWQLHPSVIWSLPISQSFELNSSLKALVPITGDDDGVSENSKDILAAFNVGLAYSRDMSRWVLRPEVGFLKNPGENGVVRHFSLGFTYYLRLRP